MKQRKLQLSVQRAQIGEQRLMQITNNIIWDLSNVTRLTLCSEPVAGTGSAARQESERSEESRSAELHIGG